jgi:hypothetical protein
MHYSINPEEIKTEIVKLGHTVTNIWSSIQYRTKLPLSMSFVEMKPVPNNKDIFNAEYIQQCKIKFEPPRHKKDIAQCANCQRYGHTKNYCHLKTRCVKCPGDHLTNQCHRKERSSDIRCVLCGGMILWIRRDVRSTRTYKRTHTHPFVWKYTLLHKSNKHYTLNQE